MDSDTPPPGADELNVLGAPLAACLHDALVASRRDASCRGSETADAPTVCAVMTQQFLVHRRAQGDDLTRPDLDTRSRGLRPGDSWCVPARDWWDAYAAGSAPPVLLSSTSMLALEVVPAEALMAHGVDAPEDARDLLR